MTRSPIVITGSAGFVGRALAARLGVTYEALHLSQDDWRARIDATSFAGSTVFHLAARVHGRDGDEMAYMRDNREKTRALAEAAHAGGARRMVFLSSVKAMGEETTTSAYTLADAPRPVDPYGRSKLAAEEALREIAGTGGFEFVVVRSPLVLGHDAKGNLAPLLRLCDSPWPLPFGAIRNRRSFVHVDDLAALLVLCGEDPRAAGRTYLAAHRAPFSTPALVGCVRKALGRASRLFAVPPALLEAASSLTGSREPVRRLTRSLEVDPSAAESDLGWHAAIPLEEAVGQMAAVYLASARP